MNIDSYAKALDVLSNFQSENREFLAVLIRVDGYAEAVNSGFDIAESYFLTVQQQVESTTNAYRELIRLDERTLLFVVAVRKPHYASILDKVQAISVFRYAPVVISSTLVTEDELNTAVLSKLKQSLPFEWDVPTMAPSSNRSIGLSTEVMLEEIYAYLQPIYWTSNRLRGFEVLARWQHPLFGIIEPATFLTHIYQQGLGAHLLLQQLNSIFDLVTSTPNAMSLWFSINAQLDVLRSTTMEDKIESVLAAGAHLEIELDVPPNDQNEIALLKQYKAKGVRFALNRVDKIPNTQTDIFEEFDTVKLSPDLIQKVARGDKRSDTMLRGWLYNFSQHNKLVIATGIQSRRVMELISGMSIDCLQGFAIKVPMSIQDTKDWLSRMPDGLIHAEMRDNISSFPRGKKPR
ncbi:EAL domain-containing protein [Vibrio vulnificus]